MPFFKFSRKKIQDSIKIWPSTFWKKSTQFVWNFEFFQKYQKRKLHYTIFENHKKIFWTFQLQNFQNKKKYLKTAFWRFHSWNSKKNDFCIYINYYSQKKIFSFLFFCYFVFFKRLVSLFFGLLFLRFSFIAAKTVQTKPWKPQSWQIWHKKCNSGSWQIEKKYLKKNIAPCDCYSGSKRLKMQLKTYKNRKLFIFFFLK